MLPRTTPLTKENYYHVYNRGVNKGLIFFSDRNYQYFLNKMAYFFQSKADILAYCLMANHFHLLLKVNSDDFVRTSLHSFLVSYTKSVNIEQKRIGPLFQNRFQANLVEDEGYFIDCAKYIHLNPAKARLTALPEDWKYSSYSAYLHPDWQTFVDTRPLMNYFDSVADFKEFTEMGMEQYESKYFKE